MVSARFLIVTLTSRAIASIDFGLSEEMLRRTLKFSKGQWLLVSYEATGLENVPLPVEFPNANVRIIEFLERVNKEQQ